MFEMASTVNEWIQYECGSDTMWSSTEHLTTDEEEEEPLYECQISPPPPLPPSRSKRMSSSSSSSTSGEVAKQKWKFKRSLSSAAKRLSR